MQRKIYTLFFPVAVLLRNVLQLVVVILLMVPFHIQAQVSEIPPPLTQNNHRLYAELLDSVKNNLTYLADSLQNLSGLPQDIIDQKTDSLEKVVQKINSHIGRIEQLPNTQINKFEQSIGDTLPLEKLEYYNNQLGKVDQKLDSLSQLSFLKELGIELDESQLGELGINGPEINIDEVDISLGSLDLNVNTDLGIKNDFLENSLKLPDNDFFEQMNSYADKVNTQIDINKTKGIISQLEKEIEGKVMNFGEVKELKKQEEHLTGLEREYTQYIDQVQTVPDQDQVKQRVVNKARSTAKEHFKDKMHVVEEAQSKMAKYKKHYDHVQSIKDLPKRPPNRMKGKPMNQRLYYGLSLTPYRTSENAEFDISPQIEFRWTGKLNIGVGGYYRVAINKEEIRFEDIPAHYGFRTFASLSGYKKFYLYGCIDLYNGLKIQPDMTWGNRQWQQGYLLGIGRSYKIKKNIYGFSIASLDLNKLKSDFNWEKWEVRFGVKIKY